MQILDLKSLLTKPVSYFDLANNYDLSSLYEYGMQDQFFIKALTDLGNKNSTVKSADARPLLIPFLVLSLNAWQVDGDYNKDFNPFTSEDIATIKKLSNLKNKG